MDLKFARGLAAMALSLAAAAASAQSTADLRNDAATPGDVTTYGMGWSLQRHTPLKRITPANVKHLAPVWNLSLDNSTNASNQPLVIDGVMYVASHTHTIAIDALTGRQKWKVAIELPNDIAGYLCCGIHTRGMAALNGVLYRTTIDAHVMAISMADGKVLWKQKAAEYKDGYSMTHAPLIADGVLITGISGGEYGSRGFLDGWDLKTGEKKWHRWTTAAPGEPGGDTWKGEAYKTGGAPTWSTGAWATAARGTQRRAAAIRCTSARCWRSSPPPARSSGTTSSRPATRTTTTAPTSWCWPTCPTCPMRTARPPRC